MTQIIILISYLMKIIRLVFYTIALLLSLVVSMRQVRYKRGTILDKKTKVLRSGIVGLFTMLFSILALLIANEFSKENLLSIKILIPMACILVPIGIFSAIGTLNSFAFQNRIDNFIRDSSEKARINQEKGR